MNKTIDYYEQNAQDFAAGTKDIDFTAVEDKFAAYLPKGALILDFGCGAGRDTKYFLSLGFQVEAMDGSKELCKIASKNTGIQVRNCLFSDLDEVEKYDGIWACASILHLPKEELKPVLAKMCRAVKLGGYIYTSFKYGDFEGDRHGRYFTHFTEESFGEYIYDMNELGIIEAWTTLDVRPGRGDERWLNIILQKSITT